MADLTDAQAAQTVKIVGSNPSTGVEDNFAEVDSNGQVKSVNPSEGTIGSPVPTSAIQIGGKDVNGNLQPLPLSVGGHLVTTTAPEDYAGLGQAFIGTTNNISIGTSETAFVLFRNPSGSGKTARIFSLSLAGSGTFRLYNLPTATANGTAITAQNRFVRSGTQGNVALMTFTPTVTANGNLAAVYVVSAQAGSYLIPLEDYIIVPANTSILITAQMGANNTVTNCLINWAEA